ncbi:TetR/AcrR family transcriptional regulator [Spirillospora sp. CA-294931]|uniref:TetR/AcrR family transcriptional regulator n=1 Tax=Spirillospora sp. CA-294931 TaxID=3240042 RepID=UPI003D948AAC
MPARGDHDARRRDVSEAVWRVLAERGFAGLTLRAVASEMGASTGLLTHYFPNKDALVTYALDLADQRTLDRERRTAPAPGMAALRAALLDVLPLDAESAAMNRIWVGSWNRSLSDAALGAREARRYEAWRERLRPHLADARDRGELPPSTDVDDAVATVASFTHGLVVQALFDPAHFPPERQAALLDGFLRSYSTT